MDNAVLPSDLLADYEPVRVLRQGPGAQSLQVRERGANRPLVLKRSAGALACPDSQRQQWLQQVNDLAQYRPEQFARVRELNENEGHTLLARDFVEGQTLEERIQEGPLHPRQAASLAEQLARALDFAHENNLIHGNLRPSNVVLRPDKAVTLLDPRCPALPGSPHNEAHVAPERLANADAPPAPAEDVWALGVLLYQMLTGREAGDITPRLRHGDLTPPSEINPACPAGLEAVCLNCLDPEPRKRYSSAFQAAKDLERFLGNRPVLARKRGASGSWLRSLFRQPAALALLPVCLLLLAALAWLGWQVVQERRAAEDRVASSQELVREAEEERDGLRLAVSREQEISQRIFDTAEQKEQEALEKFRLQEEALRRRVDLAVYARQIGKVERYWHDSQPIQARRHLEECRWDLCRWEYDHLLHLLEGGSDKFLGHTDPVRSLALSPDGKVVASGSKDATVRLWDVDTGKPLGTLAGPTLGVLALAFHPTEGKIAGGGVDKTIYVWDVNGRGKAQTTWTHAADIRALCYSRDGKQLYSASDDQTIKVWDGGPKEVRVLKGHTGEVRGLVLCADGKRLASAGTDGTVRLWDPEKPEPLQTWKASGPLLALAASPDGKRLLSGADDGTAALWDATSGQVLLTLRAHAYPVRSVAFSPDGTLMATASADRTVRVWDAATGQEKAWLRGHEDDVGAVQFAADNRRLFSAASDNTVRRWEWARPAAGPILSGHKGAVRLARFDRDGGRIATTGPDGTVRVHNARTGELEFRWQGYGRQPLFAWAPDGKRLAVAGSDKRIEVRAATAAGEVQNELRAPAKGTTALAFAPRGDTLAVGGADGTLAVWNLLIGDEPQEVRAGGPIRALAFDAAGRYLATSIGDEGEVKVWDTQAEQLGEALVVAGKGRPVHALAFSPDGHSFAGAGADGLVRVWNAQTAAEERTLAGHSEAVRALAYSPDGSRLATASDDRTVRVWDPAAGEEFLVLRGHTAEVTSVQFSPDGQALVSAGEDGTTRLWLGGLPGRARFTRQHADGVESLARSVDGKLAATGTTSGTLTVWDLNSGRSLFRVPAHSGRVNGIAFHPHGKYVASAGEDRTVIIWELPSGRQLLTLRGHERGVNGLAYSPDGTRLVTASYDNTVRVWDVATARQLHSFSDKPVSAHAVVFGSEGRWVASADYDGKVRLWNLSTGQPRIFQGHRTDLRCLAISPDGGMLASGEDGGTAIIWDVFTGKALHTLRHPGAVHSVAFSPDGKGLVTGGNDGLVRWWDVKTGELRRSLQDHTARVKGVAFRDARTLLSASEDRTLKYWQVQPPTD